MPETLFVIAVGREINSSRQKMFVAWAASYPSATSAANHQATSAGTEASANYLSKQISAGRLEDALEQLSIEMYRERTVLSSCEPANLSERGQQRLRELVRMLGAVEETKR